MLTDLWLEPEFQGRGFGRRLWEHALTVTTDNRNPPTGNKYDILQGSTMGANDFAGFTWLGEKTTAYTHTPNVQGANGKVYELQS